MATVAGPGPSSEQQAVAMRVAGQYMDLSSAHELSEVFALFAPEGSYISESLRGSWTGLTDIQGMMRPFFKKYPDVRWEVRRMFVAARPGSASAGDAPTVPGASVGDPGGGGEVFGEGVVHVEVHFLRTWTENGEQQESPGREWISVDTSKERIVRVFVAKLGTFWDFW
ncbi:hypothetical protein FOA52_013379 [Chlamydomonas sp. UWO 241]|nr:hypothetical protein FOA52_013379 [Chlamydomonas sp. UWO 241]